MGNQNNLKYWLDAIPSEEDKAQETIPEGYIFLMNYFTLSNQQLSFIVSQF